tara:strand:- start:1216 stop:2166 length:951 start_codon:yes stop_codon:yes gene_type:complete
MARNISGLAFKVIQDVVDSPTIYVNNVVNGDLMAGEWNHVVITSSTTVTSGTYSSVDLGLTVNGGTNYGDVQFSNVSFFTGKLTAAEVAAYYNEGIPNPTGVNKPVFYPLNSGLSPLSYYQPADIPEVYWTGDSYGIEPVIAGGVTKVVSDSRPIHTTETGYGGTEESFSLSHSSGLSTALYYKNLTNYGYQTSVPAPAGVTEITVTYTEAAGGDGCGDNTNVISGDTVIVNRTTATSEGDGVIINSENKYSINLISISSACNCVLRENTAGGAVICYVPYGNTNLSAPIRIPESTNVYVDGANDISVTFDWTFNV